MGQFLIRAADPDRDYSAYCEIANSREARLLTPEILYEQDSDTAEGCFMNRFLAEVDGLVAAVGIAHRIIWDPPGVGRVGVWMQPDLSGRGIGSKMADHVEEFALSKDLQRLECVTTDSDLPSRHFAENRAYELRAHLDVPKTVR